MNINSFYTQPLNRKSTEARENTTLKIDLEVEKQKFSDEKKASISTLRALPFESIEAERDYHMFMAGLCTSILDVKKPNDMQDEIYFQVLDAAVKQRREDAKSPEGV